MTWPPAEHQKTPTEWPRIIFDEQGKTVREGTDRADGDRHAYVSVYEYHAYICMPMMLIVQVVSLMMLGASWGWGFWADDAQFGLGFILLMMLDL
jgi:hypothetical protein